MNNQFSPETTGNTLVMLEPGRRPRDIDRLVANAIGTRLAHTGDFSSTAFSFDNALAEAGALSLDSLGVVVVAPQDANAQAAFTAARGVQFARPEFWMHAASDWDDRYDSWLRAGLSLLADRAFRGAESVPTQPEGIAAAVATQSTATWGLEATRVVKSQYTGAGIKLAVLDTGFDLNHPDFAGRTIVSNSFVPHETEQDVQGHGTHCIGTACGPRAPSNQLRYGIAGEAEIYVGKVLNNAGSGQEGWILAGIEWATNAGCEVISMSLGRRVQPDEPPDPIYENAGQIALQNGCLIIAAAGNESWRQYNIIQPVTAPANSVSIMSVGAVDAKMRVANFSCGGLILPGGAVDIAGPGVDVLSSFHMPRRYERLSGTSMATPHVAGIAALYAQSDRALRGSALRAALQRSARGLGLPPRDVGPGLVIAP